MNKIVSYTAEEMKKLPDLTDWEFVKNMTDEDIFYDEDSPEITDEMVRHCTIVKYRDGIPTIVKYPDNNNITLDSEVIEFFKSYGDDWRSRINDALLQIVKIKQILT